MKITFVHDDGSNTVETEAAKACWTLSKREYWVANCNAPNVYGNTDPICETSLTQLSYILALSYLPRFR